jgi:hypothetical protein
VSAVTDINVLILVGLRTASINRELAKVAVDSFSAGDASNPVLSARLQFG